MLPFMRARWLLPLLSLLLFMAACDANPLDSPTPSDSTAAAPTPTPLSIGDTCLVGTWDLVLQASTTSNGTLSGYTGARMVITSSGLETTDYNSSSPATGVEQGVAVSVTRRGTWRFQDSASRHAITRTALGSTLIETYTYSSSTTSRPIHALSVSAYTYSCNSTALRFTAVLSNSIGSFQATWRKIS